MPPKLTKSYRPVEIDFKTIKIDPIKRTFTFITEFGHIITSKLENGVSIDQVTDFPDHPDYVVTFPMTPIKVENNKDSKNLKEIREILKQRNVLNQKDDYDDIMIGFVYADDRDPMNHTWMIQFRKNQQVIGVLNFLSINTENCPMKSYAWHEGDYWHLRLVIDRKNIKMIQEYDFNKIKIIGKGIKKLIDSTSETIPKKYDKLRLRCDVKNNFWFGDFILNEEVIKTIKTRDVKLNANLFGESLFNHEKPWVSENILYEDVQDIQILDDLMIIQGKIK